MSGKGWLTIGALSRATQIPPATLRTWERRYGVPKASRKPSGHRLYPLEAVISSRYAAPWSVAIAPPKC